MLISAVKFSHSVVSSCVSTGDIVVDATAGNGHDTKFLAEMVGDRGCVYAFDIQQEALDQTRKRLGEAGLFSRVRLIKTGHENMSEYVDDEPTAVMFNLGYLPGGSNKRVITRPDTTLEAMGEALTLLRPGGVITVVMYPGHDGGLVELEEVVKFCARLEDNSYLAHHLRVLNRGDYPPSVAVIHRVSR